MGNLFPRAFRQSHGNEVGQVSPLQLVSHVVRNTSKYSGTTVGQQWDKTNREITALVMVISLCLFSPSAFLVRSFLDLPPGVFAPGNS